MHYIDEVFPGPSLMPADPPARAQTRMILKLMDEHIHISCMTLTFATANRAHLPKMAPQEMEAELTKAPDPHRSQIKREVVRHGLDTPLVAEALSWQRKLHEQIEAAMQRGSYLAGDSYSLADAAAAPYVWRIDKLKLAPMWEQLPGVAAWYERIRARPSFRTAVEAWVTPADIQRYADEPDPWPKVREILRAA
jgi:glutathione S-transferase